MLRGFEVLSIKDRAPFGYIYISHVEYREDQILYSLSKKSPIDVHTQ